MKSVIKLLFAAVLTLGAATACINGNAIKADITDLQNRVKTLEDQMAIANDNVSTLFDLISALNGRIYINNVYESSEGWVINFSDGKSATIRNGVSSPMVGVKKDTDGVYYWTLDDQWLLDADGHKIPVSGKDAVAPQLKIVDGYWYISADGGSTWEQLGQATGEDGSNVFQSFGEDDSFWYFTLANGEVIKIGKGIHGAKSITAVPKWSDGSVSAVRGEFTVSFDVLPPEAAEGLAAESSDIFNFKVVYTAFTKASVGEETVLEILDKKADGGKLQLTVDGSKIAGEFTSGILDVMACLQIVWGDNVMSSGYFHLKYDNVINGHNYVDLGLPSGIKWATCNIGADKPWEPGDYFAWGEIVPKTEYTWDNYKWGTEGNPTKYKDGDKFDDYNGYVLDKEDDVAFMVWNWRMPTRAEIKELYGTRQRQTISVNGRYGVLFTGPNGNTVFIPYSAILDERGLDYSDYYGTSQGYWLVKSASSIYENHCEHLAGNTYHLEWGSTPRSGSRHWGLPVRPVHD